jgi:hypothetical protein
MFAPFPSANKLPEAPMNNDQNNSPLLSLFEVLVEEYAHQVITHGLKPLYPDDAATPDDDAANRESSAKMMCDLARKKREEIEANYPLLQDKKEREARVNEELIKDIHKQVDEELINDLQKQVDEELIKDFYGRLHQSGEKRAALCFSGGGIRSATFGLGVLQGLAGILNLGKFHFLSTVSGGGYLGSWFSAWAHRRGMEEVQRGLEEKHDNKSPLSPEPEPIHHLRRYSNYMSPKLGLLSPDTWTLVGIYLRNLFLHWLVLIPLMAAALSLPRLWMSALALDAPDRDWVNRIFWFGFLSGVVSITYIFINRPSLADLNRRLRFLSLPQKLRSEGCFRQFGLGCLIVTAIASALYWSWIHIPVDSALKPLFGFDQQSPWGFVALGLALQFSGLLLSQVFAPQIIHWKRYHFGVPDFICGALSGAIGGLCLWMIAMAFPTPVVIHSAQSINSQGLFNAALYACFAPPLLMSAFLVAATVFTGLASYHTNDADREWMGRAGGWIMITMAVWTVVNVLVIFGPYGLIWLHQNYPTSQIPLASTGIGSGIIALLGGRAGATSAKKADDEKTKKSGLPVKLLELAVPYAAIIFALFFVVTLSLAASAFTGWIYKALTQGGLATALHNMLGPVDVVGWTDPEYWGKSRQIQSSNPWEWHLYVIYQTPNRLAIPIALIFLAFGVAMGIFVNVNKFSLHSAYRDRLIRAYMGASRSANDRRPNPFTGMDEQDNLQMHDLIRPVFTPDSFDVGKLVPQIVRGQTQSHCGKFIWSGLSQGTQDLFEKYVSLIKSQNPQNTEQKKKMMEDAVRRELTDSFNRIIHGPALYRDGVFRKALKKDSLPPPEKELISDQLEVPLFGARWLPRKLWPYILVDKLRINARMLEKAFGDLIRSVPTELREARPLHVVNMALNLVKGRELAWQNRKAQSFTVSPLHAGSLFEVGYRRSKYYAVGRKRSGAITLGTSMAISGAAASPNMGYHSSPVVTFLMALFNIRLGWWLGNPGKAGDSTHTRTGPRFAPRPLIAETLGRTDMDHPYVYLSDGGHFENLGLYEMVLRRCYFIVVSDGSQDKDFNFESLGNAMSKIRTDLGIRITFDSIPISPREEKLPTFIKDYVEDSGKKYCAIGRICYSDVDGGQPAEIDGFLLYIKPTLYGVEPADVQNYARANPDFPHESTGDQMFSESQFESYRALGFHEVLKIAPERDPKSEVALKGMFKHVYENHLGEEAPEELLDSVETPRLPYFTS